MSRGDGCCTNDFHSSPCHTKSEMADSIVGSLLSFASSTLSAAFSSDSARGADMATGAADSVAFDKRSSASPISVCLRTPMAQMIENNHE